MIQLCNDDSSAPLRTEPPQATGTIKAIKLTTECRVGESVYENMWIDLQLVVLKSCHAQKDSRGVMCLQERTV